LIKFYGYDRRKEEEEKVTRDEIISRRAVFQVFFLNILNAGKLPVNSLFRCVRVNFPLFFLFLSVENDYHFHFSVQHFFFFLK
jgi:hypothetical protein